MLVTDPSEVERQLILALVLEPLVNKEGCTTRYHDISLEVSLTNLTTQAVNVGPYFYELATRVSENGGMPRLFYDLNFQALQKSTKNLKSAKLVNYGLLELLFPLVLSRLTSQGDGIQVCKNFINILKLSSKEDVLYREKSRDFAWSKSRKDHKRNFPSPIGGENLLEHYQMHLEIAKKIEYQGGILWAEQILSDLPLLQEMYLVTKSNIDQGLLKAAEEAYKVGMNRVKVAGFVADYVGACLYLTLSDSDSDSIII